MGIQISKLNEPYTDIVKCCPYCANNNQATLMVLRQQFIDSETTECVIACKCCGGNFKVFVCPCKGKMPFLIMPRGSSKSLTDTIIAMINQGLLTEEDIRKLNDYSEEED